MVVVMVGKMVVVHVLMGIVIVRASVSAPDWGGGIICRWPNTIKKK
jgi:hypothetical protein